MQKIQEAGGLLVVIGTGGTIAGVSNDAGDNVGYRAAQIGVAVLVDAIRPACGMPVETEQLQQIDSKDIGFDHWRVLANRVRHHLARAEVAGLVITHGTDTLEETAYFLQRLIAPTKPVVLTGAMRPATSVLADGPQNLLDALTVATGAHANGAGGVLGVMAGQVHSGYELRKIHPYRLDAFGSGDAGPVAQVEEGVLRQHRPWPTGEPMALAVADLPQDDADWPWIEILTSHAGARAGSVEALCEAGVDGLVVAGTGNGTLHRALEAALRVAQARGVPVLRCSRCLDGRVIDAPDADPLPSAGGLTPVQARVELLLQLLARR